jgi:hypothetical protein
MTVPLTGCGKPMTLEDVAGTYTSDKDPKKYEISITAGGACDLTSNENGNIRFSYSVKLNGSSLEVEPPDRTAEIYQMQKTEFGDLTYGGDYIMSSKLGRFPRVKDATRSNTQNPQQKQR